MEDPLATLERNTPDVVSLKELLRQTADFSGNIQETPYLDSVYYAVHRMAWMDDQWSMHKSNKDKKCSHCQSVIKKGEQYVKLNIFTNWYPLKICTTCAARYLLDVCEAYRYSIPVFGSGCKTHWSKSKQEWVRLEVNGRTCNKWQPILELPDELISNIQTTINQTINTIFQKLVPGYYPYIHVPWLASLLNSASTKNTIDTNECVWAMNQAISFARDDGISRWTGGFEANDENSYYCIGCGRNITHQKIYLLYGELTDYLCVNCSSRTILSERTEWIFDKHKKHPYFWINKGDGFGLSQGELTDSLNLTQQKYELSRDYQRKVDNGLTIDEIAIQEGKKPSTIRNKLRQLDVVFPKRNKT